MKKILIISFFLTVVSFCEGQTCDLVFKGNIAGVKKEIISNSTVYVKEINRTIVSDTNGVFSLVNLCAGNYTILITHTGYLSLKKTVRIESNSQQSFLLIYPANQLKTIVVNSERKKDISTVANAQLKAAELFQQSGKTLGETLKSLPGLNSIQTGPSLSKPVIHGMHSNRVLILNNGIRQEGQQWGSEHAPEIDPFIANRISVIKGAASVRYGSDAIAGVILVEPQILAPEKTLQGEINLIAGTNGKAYGTSGMLEGRIKNSFFESVNWRLQGTLKKAGNFRTADYYLKNTGAIESDYSAAANFKKKNLSAGIFYSHFYNKIGIFEGSHVGNVNDLYAAFQRSRPIVASYFTYDIDRTYQDVHHDLLKATADYQVKNAGRFEAVYSFQKDLREEFDIDIPYTTDPKILKQPQVSFRIKTTDLDLTWHWKPKNNFSGSIGITGATQSNVFRGLRYLVPNFRNYTGGAYAIESYTKNKWLIEAGIRYDYRWLKTYQLNAVSLVNFSTLNIFQNVTATAGATYKPNEKFSVAINGGNAWRSPSINELFINGIHLSAASYEKGDSTLRSEKSYNISLSAKYETDKLYIEASPYNNIINGYIYAKPALQPITLISGTYPYFKYTQQNVNLSGLDFELRYKVFTHFSLDSKTTIVRGWNKTIHDYLIFIPADRFSNSLQYDLANGGHVKNIYIKIENVSVLKQTRVPPNSDYVDPPPGYSILNASAGFELPLTHIKFLIDLAAYNFTNIAYRDYLNRFRYYAADLGINIVLRTKIIF